MVDGVVDEWIWPDDDGDCAASTPYIPRHNLLTLNLLMLHVICRTSARKPDDELLADFRQQFPEVSTGVTEPNAPAVSQTTTAVFQPVINAPVHER